MKFLRIAPLLFLFLLPACMGVGPDLRGDIVAGVKGGTEPGLVVQGLLDAQYNLENAVAVGALPAEDPALPCVKSVLADLGVGQGEVQRFTPRVSELLSAASVAYIRARQLERERDTPFKLSADCKAIVGQIMIDFAKVASKGVGALPGGDLVKGVVGRVID
jgi:uncharacterized protein YfiM (DUF2279 family)